MLSRHWLCENNIRGEISERKKVFPFLISFFFSSWRLLENRYFSIIVLSQFLWLRNIRKNWNPSILDEYCISFRTQRTIRVRLFYVLSRGYWKFGFINFSTRSERSVAEAKKHSMFCMNNLYLLRDEVFPSFLEAFALQTSYVTRSNVPMLQKSFALFSVSRPLVQSDGSYLRDNASEGAQESSESSAGRNSRDNYIWWMARASYMPGALLQSDTPSLRKWYERETEVTKMPSEVEGSNFERSAKQMASHSSF